MSASETGLSTKCLSNYLTVWNSTESHPDVTHGFLRSQYVAQGECPGRRHLSSSSWFKNGKSSGWWEDPEREGLVKLQQQQAELTLRKKQPKPRVIHMKYISLSILQSMNCSTLRLIPTHPWLFACWRSKGEDKSTLLNIKHSPKPRVFIPPVALSSAQGYCLQRSLAAAAVCRLTITGLLVNPLNRTVIFALQNIRKAPTPKTWRGVEICYSNWLK